MIARQTVHRIYGSLEDRVVNLELRPFTLHQADTLTLKLDPSRHADTGKLIYNTDRQTDMAHCSYWQANEHK